MSLKNFMTPTAEQISPNFAKLFPNDAKPRIDQYCRHATDRKHIKAGRLAEKLEEPKDLVSYVLKHSEEYEAWNSAKSNNV